MPLLFYLGFIGIILTGLVGLLARYVITREAKDPDFEKRMDRWRDKYGKYLIPSEKSKTNAVTVIIVVAFICWLFYGESYYTE